MADRKLRRLWIYPAFPEGEREHYGRDLRSVAFPLRRKRGCQVHYGKQPLPGRISRAKRVVKTRTLQKNIDKRKYITYNEHNEMHLEFGI